MDKKDEVTQVTEEQAPETEQGETHNGVLVERQFAPDGLPQVRVTPLGDVRVTEIERILKDALRETERALGG